MPEQTTLHTDGGARGNPGPAGIGYVLAIPGIDPVMYGEYIGETTNNQAEYTALIKGLEDAKNRGVQEIMCYLDSELVVKQLTGVYRVKHPDMKPLYETVKAIMGSMQSVKFKHVPRAKNKIADKLVNEAIDRYQKR